MSIANSPPPTLYGISCGPGDPELITLKGWRVLQRVPVVAFPQGGGGCPGLAEQIIAPWIEAHQIQVPLEFPYQQDPLQLQQAWGEAAARVGVYLEAGQDVGFVSLGDVSFYSTFTYLAWAVHQRYPQVKVQAIPGVCSPLAAAALVKLPLTKQDERLLVLPALYHLADLDTALAQAEVVVLLKVGSVYHQVWRVLQARGLLERTYLVVEGNQPGETIYCGLTEHPQLQLPYFSLMIIYCGRS